ncbi:hypothetical protein [Alicyclobacillus dauci]|uniref:Uncharacterized protein n=1 Tax=Alicyclobacillus dauci TaxID=1475485 RepID=A0ABY6Z472_9BACL|nr:hypothetical protein [Alicyclobacillus dauci]WAH37637.1 hypothetical protein NZD86_03660 [Alicyclobacillus dauci]
MDHVAYVEQTMIAYCLGKPEDLALGTNHFNETLEEIRRDGHEVWVFADVAGIVQKDMLWYLWIKSSQGNGNIEGRIYEIPSFQDAVYTACAKMPWLSTYD